MPSLYELLYPDRQVVRNAAVAEAQRQGVDPQLALSVFQLESGFNPLATSPAKARGVGQLIDSTARSVGVTNPYDYRDNIRGSITYLRQLAQQFPGRPDLQAAAYQAGPGAVRRAGNRIPKTADVNITTAEYARRILGGIGSGLASLASPRSAEAATRAPVPQQKPQAPESLYGQLYGEGDTAVATETPATSLYDQLYGQESPLPEVTYKPGFEFVKDLPEAARAKVLEQLPDIVQPATQEGTAQALQAAAEASQYQALPKDLTQPDTQLGIVLPSGAGAATVGTQLAGRAGGIIGASLGAYGARRAAQSVGLEQGNPTAILPQDVGDVAALVLPPVLAAGGAALTAARRLIPGRQTALNVLRDTQQHAEAIKELRGIGQGYLPDIPSKSIYQEISKTLGDTPIDTLPVVQAIPALRAELGELAPGFGPGKIETLLKTVENLGNTASATTVSELFKDLTRLTGDPNGKVRHIAGKTYDLLHDALRNSASDAADLIDSARAAFRRESAVKTLTDALATGRGVIRRNDLGDEVIHIGQAQNVFDRLSNNKRFFGGTFTPEEGAAIRQEISEVVASLPKVQLPKSPSAGVGIRDLVYGGLGGAGLGAPGAGLAVGGALYGAQKLNFSLAKSLLDPSRRQVLLALAAKQRGTLTGEQLATIGGITTAATSGSRQDQVRQRLEELQ